MKTQANFSHKQADVRVSIPVGEVFRGQPSIMGCAGVSSNSLMPTPSSTRSDVLCVSPLSPLIGVFDSGVGGLSVLRALCLWMPQARFVYFADSGHAPYGERADDYVLDRSSRITRHLLWREGCQGVVVACNTATAVAVQQLRSEWPGVSLVGVEPGVKPAVAQSRNKRIGVMATTATLRHARFQALVEAHAPSAEVMAQPCPGLALAIEQGDLHSLALQSLLDQFCGQLRDRRVDTVVLGCTHYTFVHDQIAERLGPEVCLIDTAEAVARQAARLWSGSAVLATPVGPVNVADGRVRLQTSGSMEPLEQIAHHWLNLTQTVQHINL
jgi:glutamate racemase